MDARDPVTRLETARLLLVPKTPDEVREWLTEIGPSIRAQISPVWLKLVARATEPDPWTLGFGILRRVDQCRIGSCGFKGPSNDGIVEIAYGLDVPFQGKGYATEAAQALVDFALRHSNVETVRAHTFEQDGASTRVLLRCGFQARGIVIDPEDGAVWRWELRRDSA